METEFIQALIERLCGEPRVVVQTHNFPDHDAIASAFALQQLLAACDVSSSIVYHGDIQRDSLKRMIHDLHIEAHPARDIRPDESTAIVVVDGCRGNRNVADLPGEEIAVIDHHEVQAPEDIPLRDIRPWCGSCSTIVWTYYEALARPVSRAAATAMLIGINMDTQLFTRGVSREDIEAFAALFPLADIPLQNSILRNNIQTKDLGFYRYALDHLRIEDRMAFCFFAQGCDQNLLGILGDFLLALREIDFVVLCARNNGEINFSIRSERAEWDASTIIRAVLCGAGFGGGHANMAGGMMHASAGFDAEEIRLRFLAELHSGGVESPTGASVSRWAGGSVE